jgi:DNA-binding SARP family transcriptional activator
MALVKVPGLPPDDPHLVLADARRLARFGRVAEAERGFRLAESLLDDPDFQARCVLERYAVAEWLPHAPVPDAHQAPPQERSVRLSRELRHLTRTVSEPMRATTRLARGIGLLLAGDPRSAGQEVSRVAGEPELAPCEFLAVRLVARICEIDVTTDSSAGQLEQMMLAADVEGLPWLSRVLRGMEAAVLFAGEPTSWRLNAGMGLIDECEHQGDSWATCLLALAMGAACVAASADESAAQLLGQALQTAEELRAPVLAAWAQGLHAYVLARHGDPVDLVRYRRLGEDLESLGVRLVGWLPDDFERVGGLRSRRSDGHAPNRVELTFFGRFQLIVDGVVVPSQGLRPRARSLLMLLALHQGRGVHRETLIAALWPEASLHSGIRSLQVAVSCVRHCLTAAGLPEDCLQRQGDAYALVLPAVRSELTEFDRLIRQGDRAEVAGDPHLTLQHRLAALDLYAGDLLPEVGPVEWVAQERDRLRTAAAHVGAEAARTAQGLDVSAVGIRAARRSLQLDPYQDQSWHLLVALLERVGDHAAASVTRRDHQRICADLGL